MSATARKFINNYKKIKTLPYVVTKLSRLIRDEQSTMKDFEEVIKMDPTLVVRLLRLVNSPYYGISQKIDSISRAVAFIGMKDLYNLAVTDAIKHIFTSSDTVSGSYSRKRLWLHCAAVSICSKIVAERIFGVNGDNPYLAGILHDFGIIVEEQVAPEQFFATCESCDGSSGIEVCERNTLNTDHCEIGHLLTKEWDLPVGIQVAIRDHHTILDDIEPDSITGIIQISEYLTAQLGYEAIPGIPVNLSPCLASHIQENLEEYKVLMEDLPEEMEKAKDLYGN